MKTTRRDPSIAHWTTGSQCFSYRCAISKTITHTQNMDGGKKTPIVLPENLSSKPRWHSRIRRENESQYLKKQMFWLVYLVNYKINFWWQISVWDFYRLRSLIDRNFWSNRAILMLLFFSCKIFFPIHFWLIALL